MVSVWQMMAEGPASTEIKSSTFTVTVSLLMHPLLLTVTMYRVVSTGYTSGFAIFLLEILSKLPLISGVQFTIPAPTLAISGSVSMLQINVSLNARFSKGLSSTIRGFVMVSIQPLLLVTISETLVLTGAGYFHTESLAREVSAVLVLSPKFHRQLSTTP